MPVMQLMLVILVEQSDCDKYDDHCDYCGDNTPCNVSITNFENFMSPFSVR